MIKRSLLVFFISLIAVSSFSQKKDFTNDQLLKNKLPAITNPLPTVVSWEDDNHLVLRKRSHPDSSAKLFLFDPKQ